MQKIEISLVQPQPDQPPAPKPKSPKKPEPIPEPDKYIPPSEHMEDDIAKANTSNGTEDKPGRKPNKAQQKNKSKEDEDHIAEQKKPALNKTDPEQLKVLQDIFGKELEVKEGQKHIEETLLGALDEAALDSNSVENPLTELQEEKARWFDAKRAELADQVEKVWIIPENAIIQNDIAVEVNLNLDGYLIKVALIRSSGNTGVDNSLLQAVKNVKRYKLPKSPLLARYYLKSIIAFQL